MAQIVIIQNDSGFITIQVKTFNEEDKIFNYIEYQYPTVFLKRLAKLFARAIEELPVEIFPFIEKFSPTGSGKTISATLFQKTDSEGDLKSFGVITRTKDFESFTELAVNVTHAAATETDVDFFTDEESLTVEVVLTPFADDYREYRREREEEERRDAHSAVADEAARIEKAHDALMESREAEIDTALEELSKSISET